MCIRNPALGFLLNCCCTVLPLGVILVCCFFFPWDANGCTPKDADLCEGYSNAASQIHTLSVITLIALLAAPIAGALVMHCCLKRNRTWVPNEVGGIVVYLIAVGTIGGCAFYYFTAGLSFPSDILNADEQGKLCFLMAMFGIPVCGLFTCGCLFIQRQRTAKARKNAMHTVAPMETLEEDSDDNPRPRLHHDYFVSAPEKGRPSQPHRERRSRPPPRTGSPHADVPPPRQPMPPPSYAGPVSPHSAPLPRFAGVPEGYYDTTDDPSGPLVPHAAPPPQPVVFPPPEAGYYAKPEPAFPPSYTPTPIDPEAGVHSGDLTRSSNQVLRSLSMRSKAPLFQPRAQEVFDAPEYNHSREVSGGHVSSLEEVSNSVEAEEHSETSSFEKDD